MSLCFNCNNLFLRNFIGQILLLNCLRFQIFTFFFKLKYSSRIQNLFLNFWGSFVILDFLNFVRRMFFLWVYHLMKQDFHFFAGLMLFGTLILFFFFIFLLGFRLLVCFYAFFSHLELAVCFKIILRKSLFQTPF